MQGAAKYMSHEIQVYGVSNRGTHPYAELSDGMDKFSPVGAVLLWLGVNPFEIERESALHSLDCPDEDYEADCPICSEGGDTSIYTGWVRQYIEDQGVVITEEARNLLWDAETSGLALWQWLEQNPHHPLFPEPPEFALGATLTFDEYQERAEKTAIYPPHLAFEYLVPGLAAEAGEVADKYAKSIRDGHLDKEGLLKELGDVLWFVGRLASELGTPLGGIAEGNLKKLEDRQQRGVLGGSGDNR